MGPLGQGAVRPCTGAGHDKTEAKSLLRRGPEDHLLRQNLAKKSNITRYDVRTHFAFLAFIINCMLRDHFRVCSYFLATDFKKDQPGRNADPRYLRRPVPSGCFLPPNDRDS